MNNGKYFQIRFWKCSWPSSTLYVRFNLDFKNTDEQRLTPSQEIGPTCVILLVRWLVSAFESLKRVGVSGKSKQLRCFQFEVVYIIWTEWLSEGLWGTP